MATLTILDREGMGGGGEVEGGLVEGEAVDGKAVEGGRFAREEPIGGGDRRLVTHLRDHFFPLSPNAPLVLAATLLHGSNVPLEGKLPELPSPQKRGDADGPTTHPTPSLEDLERALAAHAEWIVEPLPAPPTDSEGRLATHGQCRGVGGTGVRSAVGRSEGGSHGDSGRSDAAAIGGARSAHTADESGGGLYPRPRWAPGPERIGISKSLRLEASPRDAEVS